MIVRFRRLTRPLLLAIVTVPAVAGAHVVFGDTRAAAGGEYVGVLRVTHGCAGSPTVSLRVVIPPDVTSAKPQPKPGWTVSIEKTPLAVPITGGGGGTVRDRVSAVTWTGRLDPDQFDQFGIMLRLPRTPGPLYFPTVQRCEAGENDWTMIPAAGQPWHSVKSPAPVLELVPAGASSMPDMKM